jgi:four helix bundle protein
MTNDKVQMPNEVRNPGVKNKYDLGERTAQFGEAINVINTPLINQLVRAATSVGANYMEADGAESRKDFRHKISICKKESEETEHWLRMITAANPGRRDECHILSGEAHELTLIFSSIVLPEK